MIMFRKTLDKMIVYRNTYFKWYKKELNRTVRTTKHYIIILLTIETILFEVNIRGYQLEESLYRMKLRELMFQIKKTIRKRKLV